ncbi:phage major capsid protein, partial [Veillonella sp. CAG:933]|uniref:phage major capsid protein n=1 Tax=Veillonella sp. CAG:933 TaxID=1262980 RepID=UPI00263F7E43
MRLKEIETRLAEIRKELTENAETLTDEQITALETEVDNLQEERTRLVDAQEKRTKLLARIAGGEPVNGAEGGAGTAPTVLRNFAGAAGGAGEEPEKEDKYSSMAYRKAFMQHVCRGTAIPAEYRADAVSTTTDVGAVIPTTVLNQIVQKMESTGMILALVTRTAYKGGVSIPVSTVKPTATWVAESKGSDKQKHSATKDGMITFAYHKLRCAVAVSLEVDT